MKKIAVIVLTLFFLLGLTGCTETKKASYNVDTPFHFDDLEITVGSQISFTKVNNEFDENNGKEVIKIPITIKNLKDETHSLNMFFYKVFGSTGTEVENKSALFDDSIDFAGDLKPGASYTKYAYYLYDGNGTYTIEFNDFANKISIDFNVKK